MSKAARRQKLRELTAAHKKILKDIRVIKATGTLVKMSLYGKRIDFQYRDGHLTRSDDERLRFSDEDYTLLFAFAEMLMRAIFEGYKKESVKSEETDYDDRQGRLPL